MHLSLNDLALYLPLVGLFLIVFFCFAVPWLFHLPPASDSNIANANLPIGAPGHILGTDQLGNDMFSRLLAGGRISLEVGFSATGVGFFIGANIGILAGYFGGVVENVLMRVLDILLAFPSLILAMALVVFLGPSERNEIIAISFFAIPTYARLARAETLKLREKEFVQIGNVLGARSWHVMTRHIYTNALPSLLTVLPLTFAVAMIIESTLSFLGVGVRPPTPSWGNMISGAQAYMSTAPRFIIMPAIGLSLTVLCLNLIGEQWRLRIER